MSLMDAKMKERTSDRQKHDSIQYHIREQQSFESAEQECWNVSEAQMKDAQLQASLEQEIEQLD